MSIPDYVDEYFAMKNSDAYKNWLVSLAKAKAQFFEQRGIKSESDLSNFIDEAKQYWSEARRNQIDAADQTILELFNLTVEDLEALKVDKARKRAGGKTPNHAAKNRRLVFQSFLESEANGLSYSQAVNAAAALGANPTPRTIRTWLTDLIRLGVCDIPPSTRTKKRPLGSS